MQLNKSAPNILCVIITSGPQAYVVVHHPLSVFLPMSTLEVV